ncbi:hypothetical protein BH10ACT1_BH10ACT1_08100 [soil metagenome]
MTGRPTVDELVVDLASWMLPGATQPRPPADDAEATVLVQSAETARLLGPMLLAVDAGELELPAEAEDLLVERHRVNLLWSIHLEARLLEVRDWFARAGGVQHLVIKGPAVAHLDELDEGLRSFADIDLLVAGPDIDRAVAALVANGASRPWAERRPGYDRRFAKSVTLTCSDRVEVDVHRSLCDGVHGFRIPLHRLFASPDHFDLGGESIAAPAPVHRLLHAAYHAVLGSHTPRLMSLRDIAGYLTRSDIDLGEVVAEAQRWRGEAVLATAVQATMATLRFEAPSWNTWAEGVEVAPADQSIIERQRTEGSGLGLGKLDAFRELDGLKDRLAYAKALIWPTRDHLRSRGMRRSELFTR